MANPISRIYITDNGDIVVTDLWKDLADKLTPHFKAEDSGTFCPVSPQEPAKEQENG